MRQAELWEERERRRLVRLCAAVSGNREAAEDLAQETLLEAWRNVHKLRDPAGADRWLAAIARNVCLRWARRNGRDAATLAPLPGDDAAADDLDIELELERAELAELLDHALALVPAQTRDVLVHRYVHESPHAEIAERLGISEDAVSMRLSRGKAVLRRVLASQLREEAAAHGLGDDGANDGWRETRVWCAECGRRRLLTLRQPPPGVVSFRCPGCNPNAVGSQFELGNPFFAQLVGHLIRPTAIRARTAEWSQRYFAAGADADAVGCTRCGRPVPLRRYSRDRDGQRGEGLFAKCGACGEQVSTSVGGLALTLLEVRRFRRDHPRTQALPTRKVDLAGLPALVVRFEDLLGSAGVDVLFARDSLRVLEVRGATD